MNALSSHNLLTNQKEKPFVQHNICQYVDFCQIANPKIKKVLKIK